MPANEQLLDRLLNVYGNDLQSVRNALSGIKGNVYKKGGEKESSDKLARIAKFYHDNADKMPKWLHRTIYNTVKDASFSENPISEIKYGLLPNMIHNRAGMYDNMFLMSPTQQEQALRAVGFEPIDTAGNYGLVNSAVQRYKNATGRDVPIYQKGADQIERERLTPLNNDILSGYNPILKVISDKQESINEPSDLGDTGSTPYRLYRSDDGKLYYRMWDFFDHGDYSRDSYTNTDDEYVTKSLTDNSQKYGNLLDTMGNPFVKTTGFTEVPNYSEALRHLSGAGFVLESEVPEYMDRVNAGEFDYKDGGSIHIKPENRGKFTALKERTGHSASWFKAHGTPAQKKMAVFELNSRKWSHKHENGGLLDNIASSDATRVQSPVVAESIMVDTSPKAILNRANNVYTNYQDAPDYNASTLRDMGSLAFRKALRHYKDNVTDIIPSGLSNCTLTATQWIDPTNPIAHAGTIVENPQVHGYEPVDSADIMPGDLFIARNPNNNSYHTMLVEGRSDKEGVHNIDGNLYPYFIGEPLLRYSRGGHDNSFIRRAVPMGSYMSNSDGKTEKHFYRYKKNKPTDYFDNLVLPTFE